eukprot:2775265-Amphidinium_carterae.1
MSLRERAASAAQIGARRDAVRRALCDRYIKAVAAGTAPAPGAAVVGAPTPAEIEAGCQLWVAALPGGAYYGHAWPSAT